MATPLENYQTAYQYASDQIATLSIALTSGSDLTGYSIEGQSVSKKDIYAKLDALYMSQERLKRLIQMEDGPFERRSYGVV